MSHDGGVSFESNLGEIFLNDFYETRVGAESCSSARLSNDFESFVSHVAEESFEARRVMVANLQVLEIFFINVCNQLVVNIAYLNGRELHCESKGKNGQELILMSLILNEPSFLFRVWNSRELPSHSCISERNRESREKLHAGGSNEHDSDEKHGGVENSDVSDDLEIAFLVDSAESHEHVSSWDPYIFEGHPSIFFRQIAYFSADVTTFNAR